MGNHPVPAAVVVIGILELDEKISDFIITSPKLAMLQLLRKVTCIMDSLSIILYAVNIPLLFFYWIIVD